MFFLSGLPHYGVVTQSCLLKCVSYLGILVNLGHLLGNTHPRSSVFCFDKSRPLALQGHLTMGNPALVIYFRFCSTPSINRWFLTG